MRRMAAEAPRGARLVGSPAIAGGVQALQALIEEARRRARRRRRAYAVAVLAVSAVAAVAYGVRGAGNGGSERASAPLDTVLPAPYPVSARNGALTVIDDMESQVISTLVPSAAPLVTCTRFEGTPPPTANAQVCQGRAFSIDWAPDGRRLALGTGIGPGGSLTEFRNSGLYVYDTAARTHVRRTLACFPTAIDWSPDGSRLAYVCDGRIRIIAGNLTGRPRLFAPDEARYSSSPSWAPDGERIVFAAVRRGVHNSTPPAIYVARAPGYSSAGVVRIGMGFTPAWSPDGTRIAFRAGCGIRLMTPTGLDVTPPSGAEKCADLGVAGTPVWSPDGRKIAISSGAGTHTMRADGGDLRLVSMVTGRAMTGSGRPAWRPLPARER